LTLPVLPTTLTVRIAQDVALRCKEHAVDGPQFDDLAKRFATSRSRRATLKCLGKTMAVAFGLGGPIAGIA
jgi:hypothetical protein